ncbi:MAG: hypothetical protein R6X27_13210 [Candidatus Desulfacyla sp.]
MTALDEWGEEWVAPLGVCETGKAYVFRGELWRDGWQNGVYPAVRLWGKEFLLDTHLKAKEWQPVRVNVVCPDEVSDPCFRFVNRHRGTTFTLRGPSVKRKYRFRGGPGAAVERGFFNGDFFPIGVYGADLENLEGIKRLAINTVILGGSGEKLREKVERCHEVGLRYVLSVPRDPDRLPVYLDEISRYVRPYDTAFYVNDEPGIGSFPVNRANDIHRLIKDRFPGCATCMAVVRPQVCGDYAQSADFFMMDQYPVPNMPMTWLSECMGECGRGLVNSYSLMVNRNESTNNLSSQLTNQPLTINESSKAAKRVAAVIQAFGGDRWQDVGWPRLPTWQEMDCLAFLSVVHGARGIFFYTYGVMGRTEEGRERLGRVVGRLNQIYPWLVKQNSDEEVKVEMVSENRVDPKGRPAVQGCVKRRGDEWMVIAVNTIGTYVEAELGVTVNGYSLMVNGEEEEKVNGYSLMVNRNESTNNLSSQLTNQPITINDAKRLAREVFSGEEYAIRDGRLRARFGPYGVKAFVFPDGEG